MNEMERAIIGQEKLEANILDGLVFKSEAMIEE